MPTKTVTLETACKFVRENHYLLAIYRKEGHNYQKISDCFTLEVDTETPIIVKTTEPPTTIDFTEFITEDKKYCFRLHNNYNVPNIIPVIELSKHFPDK